jgi:hypothetical protein
MTHIIEFGLLRGFVIVPANHGCVEGIWQASAMRCGNSEMWEEMVEQLRLVLTLKGSSDENNSPSFCYNDRYE